MVAAVLGVSLWLGVVSGAWPTRSFASWARNARRGPIFVFRGSLHEPADFRSRFARCVQEFRAAEGPAGAILAQLDGAEVIVSYEPGGGDAQNPTPGGDSVGKPVEIGWDSGLSGRYPFPDQGARERCAVLLHELEHAARFFRGAECTASFEGNAAAYLYDEELAVRAENWWLRRLGRQQRTTYGGHGLPRWTRWPARGAFPIPPGPACGSIAVSVEEQQGVYGGGRVTSMPRGIDCMFSVKLPEPQEPSTSGTCRSEFRLGTTVTLTARPDAASSSSVVWGSGVACGGNSCALHLGRSPAIVPVGFALRRYTLTVENPDLALGVLTAGALDGTIYCGRPEEPQPQKCSGLFEYGTPAIVTATPDPPATGVEAFHNCTSTTPPPFAGPGVCRVSMTGNTRMAVHWRTG